MVGDARTWRVRAPDLRAVWTQSRRMSSTVERMSFSSATGRRCSSREAKRAIGPRSFLPKYVGQSVNWWNGVHWRRSSGSSRERSVWRWSRETASTTFSTAVAVGRRALAKGSFTEDVWLDSDSAGM